MILSSMTSQARIHLALFNPRAGVPHEVLESDFWVPGSTSRREEGRYKAKAIFQEMLECTEDSCVLYFTRAIEDRSFYFPNGFAMFCRISLGELQRMIARRSRPASINFVIRA